MGLGLKNLFVRLKNNPETHCENPMQLNKWLNKDQNGNLFCLESTNREGRILGKALCSCEKGSATQSRKETRKLCRGATNPGICLILKIPGYMRKGEKVNKAPARIILFGVVQTAAYSS